MRILVIEDEPKTGAYLKKGLQESGYSVDVAADGAEGLLLAQEERYDVIVLDVMLPTMDGWSVLKTLREQRLTTPVLFLTARDDVHDRVRGLELGADDYLVKPFRFPELVARIRALSRRAVPSRPAVLQHGDLELDPARREVRRAGQPIVLARKEFGVLEALMMADGAALSSEDLLERVWDEQTDPFTNVVRMTIMTLRRKLGEPQAIETVIGVGYRMS
jgi:two-component system copper resistance phosphate regulon response regulator CusR